MKKYLLASTFLVAAAYAFAGTPGSLTPPVNGPMIGMNGGQPPSTTYVSGASQVMATTSDVSFFSSTGAGTQTIPANGPYAFNSFMLRASGVYTAPTVNTATATIKIKWASTTIASITTNALGQATNAPFSFVANCTIQSIATPSASTIVCRGNFSFMTGVLGLSPTANIIQTTSPVTIDTTVNSKLDATLAWSSVAGGQTATGIEGQIEITN